MTGTLRGERVALAPLGAAHLSLVRRWRSDPEVTRYWISDAPPSEEEIAAWHAANLASGALTWVILDAAGQPIGYTNLFDVDSLNRHAELALMIGDRAAWGQGYAKESLRVLLAHAFAPGGGLGLHKVSLTVFAENAAARRVYAACGFQEDGVLREDFYRGERWHDQILMSILAREFQTRPDEEGRRDA